MYLYYIGVFSWSKSWGKLDWWKFVSNCEKWQNFVKLYKPCVPIKAVFCEPCQGNFQDGLSFRGEYMIINQVSTYSSVQIKSHLLRIIRSFLHCTVLWIAWEK